MGYSTTFLRLTLAFFMTSLLDSILETNNINGINESTYIIRDNTHYKSRVNTRISIRIEEIVGIKNNCVT